jgi:glycosyltransferase involved in cell wall biosynthesis
MLVLHDTYPFKGGIGSVKERLFVVSALTSRCLLAYINTADGLAFYRQHGFDPNRLVFAPNRFPGAIAEPHSKRPPGESRLIVGLVGTDSPKKNYPALLSEIRRLGRSQDVVFAVYGHATGYFRSLLNDFPDLVIRLVESDRSSIPDFLGGVDVLVSVATNEGFGRPIAGALQSGVPCYLIDNPVFREFFDGAACFSPDVDTLVTRLFEARLSADGPARVSFAPPAAAVAAFAAAAGKLEDSSSGQI